MFWLSTRSHNDLFLLYAFADLGRPARELRALVRDRAAGVPDLRVRVREVPGDLAYPALAPCDFSDEQFVEHPAPGDWAGLRAAVGGLLGTGVDATVSPWRVHVFRGVTGAPMCRTPGEPTTVSVLQISHALVDGRRAAEVARQLFAAATESGTAAATAPGAQPPPRPVPGSRRGAGAPRRRGRRGPRGGPGGRSWPGRAGLAGHGFTNSVICLDSRQSGSYCPSCM